MKLLIFGSNISWVKLLVDPVREDLQEPLFDDPERESFGERTYIPGEKCSFIGVEYGSMSSVVSLGVTSLVSLSIASHKIHDSVASIPGAVASVFLGVTSVLSVIFSVGSAISVLK